MNGDDADPGPSLRKALAPASPMSLEPWVTRTTVPLRRSSIAFAPSAASVSRIGFMPGSANALSSPSPTPWSLS